MPTARNTMHITSKPTTTMPSRPPTSCPQPPTRRTQPVRLQPSPQPTPKPNVGTLPEPPPDVVVLENNKEDSSSVIARDSQTLTDVPLIPSGNTDNFYTLYSQVNYNVVF